MEDTDKTEEILKRFYSKVDKKGENGCWLWTGGIHKNGYGVFWNGRENVSTHRYSYELEKGSITKGLCVLHECYVRNCVNPSHLWEGTHKENYQNMLAKGRVRFPRFKHSPKQREKISKSTKKRWDSFTPEEEMEFRRARSEGMRRWHATRTWEQHREQGRKMWETRRRRPLEAHGQQDITDLED